MSRNGNRILKLIAALGVFGLMMAFSVARVSAFSDANFKGSYACSDSSDADFFTAVFQYTPDGAGGYSTGTLVASLDPFFPFNPSAPASQFCTYFLQTAASAYSIDTTGLGFETLSWTPSVANNPLCPGTFINESQTALGNELKSGIASTAEYSDDNLLDIGDPGHGTCGDG